MKTLWFDFTNTPHVNFLKPIIKKYLANNKIIISAGDFSETAKLTQLVFKTSPIILGRHSGKGRIKKL